MSRTARAKLSRLMMVLGLATTVVGIGIRLGAALGPTPCGTACAPQPTPGPSIAVAVPTVSPDASTSPAPSTAGPAVTPSADATAPPEPGVLWFGDDFDAVAAWPDGTLDWMTTSVAGGRYRIAAQVTDLPVVVMAAAGEGAPNGSIVVTMRLTLAPGTERETGAGLVLESLGGERLLLLVSADGRVSLLSDSIESLDLVASGTIDPPTGSIKLALSLRDDIATASVDASQVASARVAFAPIGFGIGVWAPLGSATIDVDQYQVWMVGEDQQT